MNELASIHTIKTGLTNVYLIKGKSTIIVDTAGPGKTEVILSALKKLSVDPLDIKLIVLTHTHWDHVGSIAGIADLTRAKILVHASEAERIERGIRIIPPGVTGWGRFLSKNMMQKMVPEEAVSYKVDIVMEDSFDLGEYGIDGSIIHTPGHSPGSVSIVLSDGRAIVGDTAMSALFLRPTPGLPIFAEQPEKLEESWKRLRAAGAEKIYPAHGRSFMIERIKI